MAANTLRLHCVLRAMLEKVYRAFLDPEAMAKWRPPASPEAPNTKIQAPVNAQASTFKRNGDE
jgi:uncharacterized protein YndB with AHSA1/START domain